MTKKMNAGMKSVCILVQNYYEIDIRVRRKAEALVAAGYQVDVLALASSFSKEKNYTLNGVNVCTISLGKKRGSLLRYAFEYLAFFLWCLFKLTARMDRRCYSIVDVNNLPDFLVFAAAYAKLRGARVVFDMHEITPEFYMSKYGIKENSVAIKFLKLVERASMAFADHIITINEPISQLLETRGLEPSKTTLIMNTVDEGLFASASKAPAPSVAANPKSKFVLMYHGTLTRIYGLDLAIEAFAEAFSQMQGVEFWLLGGGPEKAALQERARKLNIQDAVKFVGNVLPTEVPNWLQCCDVGVLATRRDIFLDYSFSNKLSEYIVMGKPVISSGLRTIRHYFSQDALAFFEPNDVSDLARQMLRLFRSAEVRAQLVAQAKQEYAPINWDVMKSRYLQLMSRMVEPNSRVSPTSRPSVVNAGVRNLRPEISQRG